MQYIPSAYVPVPTPSTPPKANCNVRDKLVCPALSKGDSTYQIKPITPIYGKSLFINKMLNRGFFFFFFFLFKRKQRKSKPNASLSYKFFITLI